MRAGRPIPVALADVKLDGIAIRESGDPLIEVMEGWGVHVAPAYRARGIASAPERVHIRRGVLDRLRQASAALPIGVDILIWDGLRSLETQSEIVDEFRSALSGQGRDAIVEQYLALPPESEQSFRRVPPPHTTGGAVDVTLCDTAGRQLDLGADFDQFDKTAWLAHYEQGQDADGDAPGGDAPGGDGASREQRRTCRRLLYWAMLDAGFAPYPWEYWHYEFGTLVTAAFYGDPVAVYGPAVPWVSPLEPDYRGRRCP